MIIKIITAIQIFKKHSEFKEKLWGSKFWTSGYYVNTVGQYGNSKMIKKYVQNQGSIYKTIFRNDQFSLFKTLGILAIPHQLAARDFNQIYLVS